MDPEARIKTTRVLSYNMLNQSFCRINPEHLFVITTRMLCDLFKIEKSLRGLGSLEKSP